MHRSLLIIIVLFSIFISGCATSAKVSVVEPGDNKLSCEKLNYEIDKLSQANKSIESKKGMTGTNVAAALFWIPGLAYTYYDAGQAEELIAERKSHLVSIMNDKDC